MVNDSVCDRAKRTVTAIELVACHAFRHIAHILSLNMHTYTQAIQIFEAKADRGADQVNRDEWLAVLQGDACSGKGGSGASGRERIGGAKNKSNGGSGRCSRFSMVDEQQVRRACFRFDGVTDCVCVTHVF